MDEAGGSSSSSSLRRWSSFDVFLSFRGEDTRSNFTSHLHMKLSQGGISVFIDDKLWRGEEISASLLNAIEYSKISVVIISENYASSSWCLDELEKIMECKNRSGQDVLPVFYKVEPCQVRKQSGRFGEAFAKHEVRFSNKKVQAWRNALTTISSISGWVLKQGDVEANLVVTIAQDVGKKVDAKVLWDVATFPVGIDRQVMNLLSIIMRDDIKMVGLYGIGGIGKTTLAKDLYNRIASDFQGCCFLENISSKDLHKTLAQLQEELLHEILMDNSIKIKDHCRGNSIIKNRLSSIKILLVLDDVERSEQLEALAGGHDWFGRGSKIIVTTRNNHLIDSRDQSNVLQRVDVLDSKEALQLFSWSAFNNEHPSSDFQLLSLRAVGYCNGLPLALRVLGLFLRSRDQSTFQCILDDYKSSYLDKGIHDVLKISYDGLEEDVKQIFLYISCCFVQQDINEVKIKLEGCGLLGLKKGITKLMDLSLITIDKRSNRIEMHGLIQQMGRTIHLSETSKCLKRKRLLIENDVLDVLKGDKEARAVKVIKLNERIELDIDSRDFEKVKNLVVLDVCFDKCSKSLEYLPGKLKWMNWDSYPFPALPTSYSGENLIELKLPWSSIKHFGNGVRMDYYKKLKRIDFSFCISLEEISDLSAAVNLEELDLYGCTSLVRIHESVGSLGKLTKLKLSGSHKGFMQFPRTLKLKSLRNFSMSKGNFVEGINPHFSEEMKSNLEYLVMDFVIVTELSPTIGYLTGLKTLRICHCKDFTTLPKTIYRLSNLTSLTVSCPEFSIFPSLPPSSLSFFPYLTNLNLSDCKIRNLSFLETMSHIAPSLRELNLARNSFSSLPSCIVNFKSLRFLDIHDCEVLEEISKVPEGAIDINAKASDSLARFPDNIFDFISCDSEYVDGRLKQLILMNCDFPEWFEYKSTKNPLMFSVPFGRRLKVFAPCVKFQVDHPTNPFYPKRYRAALNCQVFINDLKVWSSLPRVLFNLVCKSKNEYMWLIVLNPHRDFHPNWDEMMETSQEIDLNQQYDLGNNSMEIGGSIGNKKFMVSFSLYDNGRGEIMIVKSCGVHIIMDE